MSDRYLLVGLGNPGTKYANTRHNIGFRCVDELARLHGLSFDKQQSKALVASGTIAGKPVLLAKPQTFMNESGVAVRGLANFYKIPPEQVLVIFDDLDIPLGTLRIRKSGGTGGHNGMKSIVQHLGSNDFPRLRFGIDRPPGRMDPAAYVLRPFDDKEEILVVETVDRVNKAIISWLTEGVEIMMNRHNGTAEQAAEQAPAPPAPAKTPEENENPA